MSPGAAALGAVLLASATAPAAALAEEPGNTLQLAVAAGATLPLPSSKLGAGLALGVDAAWRPRRLHGWFELALGIDASQRSASGHQADARLGDSGFDWRLVARELWIVPTLRLRVPIMRSLQARVALGPALVLVDTLGGGAIAGEPFPDGEEQSAVLGVRATLGVEWAQADGAFVLEGSYAAARVDHLATGADEQLDAIGARVGYRFSF